MMAPVTQFQQSLPLSRITLNEYERRLKKLLNNKDGDEISPKQLIEVFQDHYAFKEIADANSAIHKLMNDKAFHKNSQSTLHVPYLMLLGVLICATNNKNKADKFFELCQLELNPTISHQDSEFLDYFPKLLEIAYDVMVRHHNINCPETKKEHWVKKPEMMAEIYGEIFENFSDRLFEVNEQVVNKLDNDVFVEKIHTQFLDYLQAHKIRNIVWDRMAAKVK